jgi:hypothetical protein
VRIRLGWLWSVPRNASALTSSSAGSHSCSSASPKIKTGPTFPPLRRELQCPHVGTFTGPAGTFRQRTELTKPQRDILAKLQLTTPNQVIELDITPR